MRGNCRNSRSGSLISVLTFSHEDGRELTDDTFRFEVLAVGAVVDVHCGPNEAQAFGNIETSALFFDLWDSKAVIY